MSEYVLRTEDLCKTYSDQYAVNHVSMTIRRGEIYGFIGKNGAGKTTLIRLITGLIRRTSGYIELLGKSNESGLRQARGKIGAIVETPALCPSMTALQNMEYQYLLHGRRGNIKRALALAGISETKNKKARDFSLGMRQRLGLAMVLLHEPEFIILDEPANGLDPAGIIEMRLTLKELAEKNGTTILISSHILPELSRLSTNYGIIHQGRLIRQLSAGELEQECTQYISVKASDTRKAFDLETYFLELTGGTK